MKLLCINIGKITLAVAPGYPNTIPPNGNMQLLLLKEVTYTGCPDLQVGEVYEPSDFTINFYGHPMYYFSGYYAWKPAAAFINLDDLDELEEEAKEDLISISFTVDPWPEL